MNILLVDNGRVISGYMQDQCCNWIKYRMQYHLSLKLFLSTLSFVLFYSPLLHQPLFLLIQSPSSSSSFLFSNSSQSSSYHLLYKLIPTSSSSFLFSNSSQSSSYRLLYKLIPINMAPNLHFKDGYGHDLNKVFARISLLSSFDSSMYSPLPSNSSPSNRSSTFPKLILHQPSPVKQYRAPCIVSEQAF